MSQLIREIGVNVPDTNQTLVVKLGFLQPLRFVWYVMDIHVKVGIG